MINNFTIIGRLTRDPETRYTKENKPVTLITIAINNSKDDTTFLTITLFGKTAETVGNYTKKGDAIAVTGMIRNNNWEDKDGNKHYDYQFIGNRVQFLTTNKEALKKEEKLPDEMFEQFSEKIEFNDLPFEE